MPVQVQKKKKLFLCFFLCFFQRIPRYVLLLKEVCKYTPQSHKDFLCVQNAYTQVEDLAKEVNEGKRR